MFYDTKQICVCTGHTKKTSYSFDTYEELLKWTKEKIGESKIKPGDIVEIIDEGEMYTTLPTSFFADLYWATNVYIDEEKMFDIIRHYRHDSTIKYNGIKGYVVAEYDNKYILSIDSASYWYTIDYIVIGKEGVKKVNA